MENAGSSEAADEQVASAVIEGLRHFGPEPVAESIVYLLELEHSVSIYSVASNPAALRKALFSMFGPAAITVEAKICQALARKMGVDPEGRSLESLVSMLQSAGIRT